MNDERRVKLHLQGIERLFNSAGYPVKLQLRRDTVEIIPYEGHIDTVFIGTGYNLVDITDSVVHAVWDVWMDLKEWKKRQEEEPIPF